VSCLVTAGGVAALSWEVIWQLRSTLALGASAFGTSITLAATMAGMTAGSLVMGRILAGRHDVEAVRWYGVLELTIGVAGLLMGFGFVGLGHVDTAVYSVAPDLAPVLHAMGILIVLGVSTFAMGATIPIFQLMSRQHGTSVARLYGLNTAGAAIGVLLISFGLLPWLGVLGTSFLVAVLNLSLFAISRLIRPGRESAEAPKSRRANSSSPALGFATAQWIVFGTGFATFGLEIAWFRSLRAAFQSTTDSFAIMLACVLIPLAVAAQLVPWARQRRVGPGVMLAIGAFTILLATPLVERIDLISHPLESYGWTLIVLSALTLAVLGPAMLSLGMALPWCLEEFDDVGRNGRLYGINTLGAVAGSLITAWLFLPTVGFSRTSWIIGLGVAGFALLALPLRGRVVATLTCAAALAVAMFTTSSLGRDRVQGVALGPIIVAFEETPDSTVSVVESGGGHYLVIDGFVASGEAGGAHYMQWMGRLPMLLHPDPRTALVICFGTGQTTNAVREEGANWIDVVDLNAAVFGMAGHFATNRAVLEDPRVHPIAMDGREWIRRTNQRYDVVTLEPMPPSFAGMNALYSREFYELAASKLAPGGIVTQWLPLHLVEPPESAALTAAFVETFPDAMLWLDPVSGTGVLVGRREPVSGPIGSHWPGLARTVSTRTLGDNAIRLGAALGPTALAAYVEGVEPVTDDNQRLAYGLRGRTRLSMLQIARGREDLTNQMMMENIERMAPFVKQPLYVPGPAAMRREVAESRWGATGAP
jgi:spermidine synthase